MITLHIEAKNLTELRLKILDVLQEGVSTHTVSVVTGTLNEKRKGAELPQADESVAPAAKAAKPKPAKTKSAPLDPVPPTAKPEKLAEALAEATAVSENDASETESEPQEDCIIEKLPEVLAENKKILAGVIKAKGMDAGVLVIEGFGVKKVTDLKLSQLPAFKAACEAALA